MGDISLNQSDRQIEDNLSRECVAYYCPGHLNKVKDRKLGFTTKTITYLTFSADGCELLVNMGSEQIYLYDLYNVKQPVVRNVNKLQMFNILQIIQFVIECLPLFLVFEYATIQQTG